MPAREPKPGQFRLKDFAEQDRILTVRCATCRVQVRYLVDDLIRVIGGEWDADMPPFPCSRCRTREWMSVRPGIVSKLDVGILEVRRPWKVVTIQKWRTVKLGDEVPASEPVDPMGRERPRHTAASHVQGRPRKQGGR